tara:strand:+ start:225 stop:752 length:528 start_codon:yes stop_codon:yes gene_type:complete
MASKLEDMANALKVKTLADHGDQITRIANKKANAVDEKDSTVAAAEAGLVELAEAEATAQTARADAEIARKAARATKLAELKTQEIADEDIQSLLELTNKISAYETKYGVDLAALTALHSSNETEYLAARGGVEEFQAGADNPKLIAKAMFEGGEKQAAFEQAAGEAVAKEGYEG